METPSITQPEFEGTNVRHFLAHRGSIVIKEYREIGILENIELAAYSLMSEVRNLTMDIQRDIRELTGNIEDEITNEDEGYYSITVSTLILAIVKGTDRLTSHGVKLENVTYHGVDMESVTPTSSSVLLDFDELDELMEAFDFIDSLAKNLRPQKCDYTEVHYSTKDDAQFGFYQDKEQNQRAFVKVSPHDKTAFFDLPQLIKLKELLLSAKEHLITRGAENE